MTADDSRRSELSHERAEGRIRCSSDRRTSATEKSKPSKASAESSYSANVTSLPSDPNIAYLTPEARARVEIDRMLAATGWVVQDYVRVNLSAPRGVAVVPEVEKTIQP